jgi:AraC-like DNA-binding protein/quercetin dioxygenase-like cupin family protein
MSRTGQPPDHAAGRVPEDAAEAIFVVTFPMTRGTLFDWHTHPDHQLAWAASGVLAVRTETAAWVLPPTRALWIPAGTRHETGAEGRATMRSVYLPPGLSRVSWTEPTVVAASPLLAEIIAYLLRPLTGEQRAHAEAVLADLLIPVPVATLDVPFPSGQLAGAVAAALRDDPADPRTLGEWGHEVGASKRTLARAFAAETGMPFGRWRTVLRLRAALPPLAAGEPVSNVARQVGYETPSAFVAAFRRETGVTPAAYFRPRGLT